MRVRLNRLVLAGRKRATAGLWSIDYEADDEPIDEVGERQVLLGDHDDQIAVVEIDRVETYRFADVPWDFADAEGEGFTSAAHWRDGHRSYYEREGIAVTDDDLVVCVWFTIV